MHNNEQIPLPNSDQESWHRRSQQKANLNAPRALGTSESGLDESS